MPSLLNQEAMESIKQKQHPHPRLQEYITLDSERQIKWPKKDTGPSLPDIFLQDRLGSVWDDGSIPKRP